MKRPPLERGWVVCTCGKKLLLHDNTAQCSGVYIKCRQCGKELNIKIKDGKQAL